MKSIAFCNTLSTKQLFLMDIDGTIAFDRTLIDGAMDFFHDIRKCGGEYIFITNNSTKSRSDYVKKFKEMQVPVTEESFYTSSYVMAQYLRKQYPDRLLYVMGTRSFQEELQSFGIRTTTKEEPEIAAVVVGFDQELTYEKVTTTCRLLETGGYDYLATNPDLACPTGFGFVPDCGAICEMIFCATGKRPHYIGKPNPDMVLQAMETGPYSKEQTMVIGDRLYTDIASGRNAGVDTVVVLTGEAKQEDLNDTEYPPDYYAENIRQIQQYYAKSHQCGGKMNED